MAKATMAERHFLTHKEVESYLAPVESMEENQFSSVLDDGAADSFQGQRRVEPEIKAS